MRPRSDQDTGGSGTMQGGRSVLTEALVSHGRRFGVGLVLISLIGAVCIANPSFASFQNLRDLLVQSAPVIIVGCGMTLVVLVGEIDISAGSLFGLLAALMGVLSSPAHLGLSATTVIALT